LIDDYYLAKLDRETHARDLQSLYDCCAEFVQIEWGTPSNPHAADEDFAYRGLMIYGIYSRQSELIGVLEMLRDYPNPQEWWLALLMLDPRVRNRGLGARVCASTLDWIAQEGGRAVWLGAQETNVDAQRFWSRMGFVEKERQRYVASNGHESRIVLMKKEVASTPPATSRDAISFASTRSPSS
jgi:GNAT superfamily N-acetyltransferase